MARCHAQVGSGQCNNHTLENGNLCQTHDKMAIPPELVSPFNYTDNIPPRTSTKGHQVRVNSGHRRLMTKARKKFQEGDTRSASQLARQFGGERNWWSKVVIYGKDTPRYLQDASAEQLRRYLDEPTTAEPIGVMDEIGVAAQDEDQEQEYQDSIPLTGPSLKELHDAWLKSQEPDDIPEQPSMAPAQAVVDLQIRIAEIEDMLRDVFTHLLGTGRS